MPPTIRSPKGNTPDDNDKGKGKAPAPRRRRKPPVSFVLLKPTLIDGKRGLQKDSNVDPCVICGFVVSWKGDLPRHLKKHASEAEYVWLGLLKNSFV
jgi:hypothetical protein